MSDKELIKRADLISDYVTDFVERKCTNKHISVQDQMAYITRALFFRLAKIELAIEKEMGAKIDR